MNTLISIINTLAKCFFAIVLSVGSFGADLQAQTTHELYQPGDLNPVGAADSKGFARISRNFYSLDLGGRNLDIYFKFVSDMSLGDSYMGLYWNIPFFESRVVPMSTNQFIWTSPVERVAYYRSEPVGNNKNIYYKLGDKSLYLTKYSESDIEINATKDKKVYYKFKDGLLFKRYMSVTISDYPTKRNSQYLNMVNNEENYHRKQLQNGESSDDNVEFEADNFFRVENVMSDLPEKLFGYTELEIKSLIRYHFNKETQEEDDFSRFMVFEFYRCKAEREAKSAINATHLSVLKCSYPNCN